MILPPTAGAPTRASIKSGQPAKGLAEFDWQKFAKKLWPYFYGLRQQPTRKQARKAKEKADKARLLRPFFPQSGAKVERADTNDDNRAKGRVYFTMSNGQVVRADKRARKGNALLLGKIERFISQQEAARV